MRRIVVISDTQIPYHDARAVRNLIGFIKGWRPDHIVHIGDLMDYPQPSRWSKDTRFEFEGSVKADSEAGKRFLGEIRDTGYMGPIDVIEGNHDLRPRDYLERHGPALAEYDFGVDALLDFDGHGVNLVKGFLDFAPGWTFTHGHLGFTLSRIGGQTALLAAQAVGVSVVMGHTHRLGWHGKSVGYNGVLKTLWGVEVGHLMDVKSAHYLKHGGANWQQGFGLMLVDREKVTPVLVPVHKDGSFVVDGYAFGSLAERSLQAA